MKYLNKLAIKLFQTIQRVLQYYNIIPCECGCREFDKETVSVDGGVVSEYRIICHQCRREWNYFAYGCVQYPETYTEWVSRRWWMLGSWLYNNKNKPRK